MLMKSGGTSVSRMRFFSTAHWPDEAFAEADGRRRRLVAVRVARQQLELHARRRRVHVIDRALLRIDQRRDLGEQHLPYRVELALALEHAGEPREVGLEPVLLAVALAWFRAGWRSSC